MNRGSENADKGAWALVSGEDQRRSAVAAQALPKSTWPVRGEERSYTIKITSCIGAGPRSPLMSTTFWSSKSGQCAFQSPQHLICETNFAFRAIKSTIG